MRVLENHERVRSSVAMAVVVAMSAVVGSPPALAQGGLPGGLIHRWEGEGNAQDSVGVNHGTLLGGAGYADGKLGQGFNLDGNDDRVQISSSTFDNRSNLTTTAWLKLTSLGASGSQFTIFSGQKSGTNETWRLALFNDGGQARFLVVTTAGSACVLRQTSAVSLQADTFHHVAAKLESGSGITVYFDGTSIGTESCSSASTGVLPGGGSANLGSQDGHTRWDGVLDDLRVYGVALSDAEVTQDRDFGSNSAPAANDDDYATVGNTRLAASARAGLTVDAASGVLDNDTDGDDDALTAIKVTDPGNGDLTDFGTDGSFTYTPNRGFAGTDSFTYKANDGTVDSPVATVILTVNACAISLGAAGADFGSVGGTGSVQVNTNGEGCSWGATSNRSWISIDSAARAEAAQGTGSVAYTVAANNSGNARSGRMRIAGQVFLVSQEAATCTYSTSPATRSVPAGASTRRVQVTTLAGCRWVASTNTSWLSVSAGGSRVGDGTATYQVTANPTGLARSGTLTVAGTIHTVEQAGATCRFALSSRREGFPAAGGVRQVSVTSQDGCDWTASANDNWVNVLQVTRTDSGTGYGVVQFEVIGNPTRDIRQGSLTIAGKQLTVRQQRNQDNGLPTTPQNLTLRVLNRRKIKVRWEDTSANEQGFVIRRNGDSAPDATFKTRANRSGLVDRGLQPGADYCYRVLAFNEQGNSETVRACASTSGRLAATGLEAEITRDGTVGLIWDSGSSGLLEHLIERRTGVRGVWSEIAMVPRGTRKYTDHTAESSVLYQYRLRTCDESKCRQRSSKALIATGPAAEVAGAPRPRGFELRAPEYVTEQQRALPVGEGEAPLDGLAGPALPRLAVLRIYKNYEPGWTEGTVQRTLEDNGWIVGETLFVHPMSDLDAAIPSRTDMVILPAPVHGDQLGQLSDVRRPAPRRWLAEFMARGGTVVVAEPDEHSRRYRLPAGRDQGQILRIPAATVATRLIAILYGRR